MIKTGKSKFVSSVMHTGWQDIPAECSQKVPKETINLSLSRTSEVAGVGGAESILRGRGMGIPSRGQVYVAQSSCTRV